MREAEAVAFELEHARAQCLLKPITVGCAGVEKRGGGLSEYGRVQERALCAGA